MTFGIIGGLILQRSIDNRNQIIHILEANRIGDNIPSLNMISKKYLKIRVMHIVYSHIYCMVLSARIRGVFHSVEFYVGEVADDVDFLYLPVLLHYLLDELLVHLLQSADEQLPD